MSLQTGFRSDSAGETYSSPPDSLVARMFVVLFAVVIYILSKQFRVKSRFIVQVKEVDLNDYCTKFSFICTHRRSNSRA